MKRVSGFVLLLILVTGCSRDAAPVTVYGQSPDHWLAELKKPNPRARKKAVLALSHVTAACPEALPALIEAIRDPDAKVRDQAITALAMLEVSIKDAVPALKAALADPDATVRTHAKLALEKIEKSS